MDRRTLLTILICFAIFFGWQKLYIEPRMPKHPVTTAQQEQAQTPASSNAPTEISKAPSQQKTVTTSSSNRPPQSERISNEIGTAVISNGNALLQDWTLKTYRLGIASDAAVVDMSSVAHENNEFEVAFDDPTFAYLANERGELTKDAQGAVTWSLEDPNIKLTKRMTASEHQPWMDVTVTAEFKNKAPKFMFLTLTSHGQDKDAEARDRGLVYFSNEKLGTVHVSSGSVDLEEIRTPVKYIGATNRYFLLALIPQGVEAKGLIQPIGEHQARASLVFPVPANSNKITIPLRAYFGPKELDLLRRVEPTLDHAVNFGFFTIVAYPLLKILKWLYSFLGNYGVAIILLTLLIKILTYPLNYKSMKSMREMAKLQPQIQRLKDKHKDDREALNREMLTLMRSHGYNPMAGCLPVLIQMPIFFALYQVLYSSIELYHAPFAFWIQDLSSPDHFYVTPVLMTLAMFLQQKIMPSNTTDPMQAKMMQFMPLIFGAFMLTLPSGLTIYMLVNSLASIAQQFIMNKKLDIHVGAVPARAR